MSNEIKKYKNSLFLIENSLDYFKSVDNDNEMREGFVDEFTTNEQRKRDIKISELLIEYVEAYKQKNKSNKWYKGILFAICILIIVVFSVIFIILLFENVNIEKSITTSATVELVSVCVTFLTLIVGILTIITKYVFPEKEEEYITNIVRIIQKNDLENKKENIKAQKEINKESIKAQSIKDDK